MAIIYKDNKWLQNQSKTLSTKIGNKRRAEAKFKTFQYPTELTIEKKLMKNAIIEIRTYGDDKITIVINKDKYKKNKENIIREYL